MSKVLCPGEMLIDFFCVDRGSSLSSGVNFTKKAGGASANVAIAIHKLGAEGVFLGTLGNDSFGEFLINTLKRYGAPIDGVTIIDTNTTLAFVSLEESGERDFNFVKGAASHLSFDMIDSKLLHDTAIIHFGSAMSFLGDELEETYFVLLDYAIKNDILITFDPNYRDVLFSKNINVFIEQSKAFISKSHIVKVSEEEALLITNEESIEKAADVLLELGALYVLITLGSKGTLLCHKDRFEYIPVIPVEMVDATGAGDAFIGGVLAKLAHTKDLSYEAVKSYVQFGNKVGSITVQKIGALDSVPTIQEIEK